MLTRPLVDRRSLVFAFSFQHGMVAIVADIPEGGRGEESVRVVMRGRLRYHGHPSSSINELIVDMR